MGFVLIGYASSFCSLATCQREAGRRLTAEFQGCDQVYCIGWPSDVDPHNFFSEKTIVIKNLPVGVKRTKGIPSLGLDQGRILFPFVVEVRWMSTGDKLVGELGKNYYFTFFGIVVRVASSNGAI